MFKLPYNNTTDSSNNDDNEYISIFSGHYYRNSTLPNRLEVTFDKCTVVPKTK